MNAFSEAAASLPLLACGGYYHSGVGSFFDRSMHLSDNFLGIDDVCS